MEPQTEQTASGTGGGGGVDRPPRGEGRARWPPGTQCAQEAAVPVLSPGFLPLTDFLTLDGRVLVLCPP